MGDITRMSQETKRYIIPLNLTEEESFKTAFRICAGLLREVDEPQGVVLFLPQKGTFNECLERTLGEDLSRRLIRDKVVNFGDGSKLSLETRRTFRRWKGSIDIIVGIYVTEEMFDQIDSVRQARGVIVVPWDTEDVREWRRAWNPETVGEGKLEADVLIENPKVERNLIKLTKTVNLSSPLSHRSDRSMAIELLRELYEHREVFEAKTLKAWALRNGWSPEGANALRDIAQAILLGKRIK